MRGYLLTDGWAYLDALDRLGDRWAVGGSGWFPLATNPAASRPYTPTGDIHDAYRTD